MAEKNSGKPTGGKEAYKCKTCKISLPDIYAYAEHLESKDHIKGVMKQKYGEKYLEAKAKLSSKNSEENSPDVQAANESDAQKSSKESEKTIEDKSKFTTKEDLTEDSDSSDSDAEVYPCDVCNKVCTGLVSYKLHLEGKKHLKTLKKLELYKKMKDKNLFSESNAIPKGESLLEKLLPQTKFASTEIECAVCNKRCTGPEVYKQHCKSAAHQKKIAMESLKKEMQSDGVALSATSNEDGGLHCDICQKAFSGPLPYLQHMEGTSHKKQKLNIEALGKIKDLIVCSEGDSKFYCKECGKTFSGPVPFNDHVKSSQHGKLKKKSDLLENLEKKHPEMIKAVSGKSDDDSEEENVILACDTCHTVFSGPEAAQEHFKSDKHKKAIKKISQFQKFKQQKQTGKLLIATAEEIRKLKKKSDKVDPDSSKSTDSDDEFDIISPPRN